MLEAGASGYLLKDCDFNELVGAVRTVASGSTYLTPSVAGIVVENYVRHRAPGRDTPAVRLTPREREILQLMAEGHSVKDIAQRLHISVKTVETHRHNTMAKLHMHSLAELTKYAIREGLTSLEN